MTRRLAIHLAVQARIRKSRSRARLRRIVAILVSVVVASVGMVVLTSPAVAATRAYGFEGSTGWLGTVTAQDGSRSICVNPIGLFPSGATTYAGLVSSIEAQTAASNGGYGGTAYTSGAAIQELNYAEGVWVNTKSNVTAAALDLFAYSLVADYPGPVGSQTNLNYYSQRAGAAAAEVRATEATIAKQTMANWNKPAPASAPRPDIRIDKITLAGTVTLRITPSDATGVLTLVGATESTTNATSIDVTNGQVVKIDATPTPKMPMRYTVIASVTWTVPGVPWNKLRKYHTDSPKYAQIDMAPAGSRPTTISALSTADDPAPQTFAPIVSTELSSKSFNPGETLDDEVTADVADGSGPWLRDDTGTPAAVVAEGTWYLMEAPKPLSEEVSVPATATPVGERSFTLSGPGTYVVSGPPVTTPGFYTVVWSINAQDQSSATADLLPTGYEWADDFGESAETGVIRSTIEATTDIDTKAQGIGQTSADTVSPSLGDGTTTWPVDESGVAVDVPFYGTEYWIPGDDRPTLATKAPTSAVVVANTVVTANSLHPVTAPETAPKETQDGFLVWQWSTPESEYVAAWSETFGEPSQMVRVTAPTLVSNADATVALSDEASDSVTVLGPEIGFAANLRWAAYLQVPGSPPTCDSSTLAFDSASAAVPVTGPGTFSVPSPPTFPDVGTYLWVATLSATDDGTVLAQGTCGDQSEVTTVRSFTLTTAALALSAADGVVGDTASVDGPTPSGATLRFRAYRQDESRHRCDPTNLVYTSDSIPLKGSGTYRSDRIGLTEGRYDWVATVYSANGRALESGRCGDPSERSRVVGSLAHTGMALGPESAFAAIGALFIGTLLLGARTLQRRREK